MLKKVTLTIWLLLCVAVLVFAVIKREIHDTDIAFLYLMLFLTFPSGWLLSEIVGVTVFLLNSAFSIVVPGGLIHNVVLWVLFVLAGYYQWFKLIPFLYTKIKTKSHNKVRVPQSGAP